MNPITDYMNMCLICGSTQNIHKHHLCMGNANRQKSEDYLLYIPLCAKHHNMSDMSVHHNKEMNVMSRIIGQLAFEKQYCAFGYTYEEAREKFIKEFGKSFL